MTAPLHTFDNKDVFDKDTFPQLCIRAAQSGIRVLGRIIKMHMLGRFFRAIGHQNDGKGVIAVHAHQHVGIDSDIFRRLIPFVAECREIREQSTAFTLQLAIDQRTLAGIFPLRFNVIVILKARIAVQPGMHPRQMIALAIILNSELPVAVHLQLKDAVSPAVIKGLVELSPAGDDI